MPTPIVVPDAGQTTDELLLAKWHVKVGDEVEVGDFLCDIETDKAVAELESYLAGHVLKLMAEEGDTVTTGQTLLWIGEPGETVPDVLVSAVDVAVGARTPSSAGLAGGGPAVGAGTASPSARTAARERGIDLASIDGSGPDGCILKRDVLAAGRVVPLSPMRRAIAARLQESVREAPQFQAAIDVDMTAALAVRREMDPRPTINDLIVKAVADTLAEFPQLRCRLEGDAVRYLEEVNLGIAVSVEDGLVVPVLAGADQLTLAQVTERSRRLIEAARAGRLPAGAASTFTVSNLGMYGVKWFSAILNPPEAAILAVGALEDRLVLKGSQVAAIPSLTLVLTCDHRIIDGQLAARFLQALKARVESADASHALPA
jgi:pyruvate dehydrogenase E2 component (dihydrolipoamide acetyltransferase)